MATEEITISELELADEVLADMTLPVDTATETRAVTLKQLQAWLGSSLPTGFIIPAVGKISDERFTLLDGKTLSRAGTYEAFCNKVVSEVQAGNWASCTEDQFNQEVSQTGQCNKFVVTNDYVRIPKFGNSMYSAVIGGKIPVFGNGMTLGLTNGTTNRVLTSVNGNSEMYYGSPDQLGTNVGTNSKYTNSVNSVTFGITTDPTKSGIEGTLSTNPMTIYYYMVVSSDGQTEEVGVNINKVYEDMNLKATTDLSNVSSVASSFKEQSVGWGMPDYTAGISISSGHEATESGWVISNIYSDWGTSSANGRLLINGIIVSANYHSAGGAGKGHNNVFIVPISKKDVVTYTGDVSNVIFYPCKGVN